MIAELFDKIWNKVNPSVYYCNALSGDSNYNICINCDMTVSCNCQDYEGKGQIGDLNKHSLEEIFSGEIATNFRKKLYSGIYAIDICAHCPELRTVRKLKGKYFINNFKIPSKGIMIENTILCNLNCMFCPSKKVSKIRKEKIISQRNLEKISLMVSACNINEIFFHNLGEPFLPDNVNEQLAVVRKFNPTAIIYTSTNGLLLDCDLKREAAMQMNHIFFSIDGSSQETLEKYQAGGSFEKQYANMKQLVDYRNKLQITVPTIEWKYLVFSWNDSAEDINRAIELAKAANVDVISFQLGSSFDGGPPEAVSQRYLHDGFFQQIGNQTDRGREIDFRIQKTMDGR